MKNDTNTRKSPALKILEGIFEFVEQVSAYNPEQPDAPEKVIPTPPKVHDSNISIPSRPPLKAREAVSPVWAIQQLDDSPIGPYKMLKTDCHRVMQRLIDAVNGAEVPAADGLFALGVLAAGLAETFENGGNVFQDGWDHYTQLRDLTTGG